MLIRKIENGRFAEYVNKREFYTFCHEYLNIVDPKELWLDIIEYGTTSCLYWNGQVFRFEM